MSRLANPAPGTSGPDAGLGLMSLPIPRLGPRPDRTQEVPKPFSREWLALPPEQRSPPSRTLPELPAWIPSEGVVAAILVLLLVLASAIGSGGLVPTTTARGGTPPPVAQATVAADEARAGLPTAGAETPQGVGAETTSAPSQPTTAATAGAGAAAGQMTGAILPTYRVVSYYGHPHDASMGILGEFEMNELLEQLMDEVAAFDAADPSRPVMPAFEVIASVAQNWPGVDGKYLSYTDSETIQAYVDFTREHDMLLILDLQIGHSTIMNEIDRVREWLAEPHVHLALDPEFAMEGDAVPGEVIGGIDASDVAEAQEELAEIVAEYDLPPKLLIVHKFEEGMITNVQRIEKIPGVQTVIDFDGQGDPVNKIAGYNLFLVEEQAEFAGIKLFYRMDTRVMSAEEILALERPPDLVIYQ